MLHVDDHARFLAIANIHQGGEPPPGQWQLKELIQVTSVQTFQRNTTTPAFNSSEVNEGDTFVFVDGRQTMWHVSVQASHFP